jgi:hypothetical protein
MGVNNLRKINKKANRLIKINVFKNIWKNHWNNKMIRLVNILEWIIKKVKIKIESIITQF